MTGSVMVTGGSSPLGDIVLPRIIQACGDESVFATARSAEAARRIRRTGAVPVPFDFSAPRPVGKRTRTVIHLAGIKFAPGLASLMRDCGSERAIVISSASAVTEGHPNRESVLQGEALLQSEKFDAAILRPTMIYGSYRERNVRRLADACARLPAIPSIRGGGLVMPVFADDVASAIIEVFGSPGSQDPRPVGGPRPLRMGDILDSLASAAGFRRIRVTLPIDPAIRGSALLGAHGSKLVHAVQMLGVDRIVSTPGEVGFEYVPTEFRHGVEVALRRYKEERSSNV